ncbi:MAG TPA: menaquinone biosynthesis protein [Thermoguttaceae bacterium]|nr:menaquinone biosynthesis protein [Thermoguttaceae bacterium]
MGECSAPTGEARIRIGAVAYLNARPLTFCLRELDSAVEVAVDLPSRLADRLAAGQLDVALVPSIEYFRNPGYSIVSDACVACEGPVRSVRLYGRVPVERVRTLALDEGSRTSAALVRILLKERFSIRPQVRQLPIGVPVEDSTADATMVIGDRGIQLLPDRFEFVWDLGEEWTHWTGLPFVFAMWVAREGVDLHQVASLLASARDRGVTRLAEIARLEAPALGLSQEECLSYLRDNLGFHLGHRQQQGLERFYELAAQHGLAPAGAELVF